MVFSAWHHATSPVARLKIYVWHGELPPVKRVLPRQEIAMRGSHSHCHVWLILKAMLCPVTRDEETHCTLCFEAYLHCIIS